MTRDADPDDLLLLDGTLWVLAAPTGVAAYDFPFDRFFPCRRPWQRPAELAAVARVGAFDDYPGRYAGLLARGVRLVHSPAEHVRCSTLPGWYPLIPDLTPRSLWFDRPPPAADVGAALGWPVFVKGTRQTSRHARSLSIVPGPDAFDRAMAAFARDPILGWQGVACREFVRLRPAEDADPARIPASFEFRTFWWRGRLVGLGRYWWEARPYGLTDAERAGAVAVAGEAARRVAVPFLVVDVAQAADGRWLVVECNDGQESGYAGATPVGVWQTVLEVERGRPGSAADPHPGGAGGGSGGFTRGDE
jgi:hypothetical protein